MPILVSGFLNCFTAWQTKRVSILDFESLGGVEIPHVCYSPYRHGQLTDCAHRSHGLQRVGDRVAGNGARI